MSALISVVVPTRNRRHLLTTTIAAILGQHAVDLELLVVDEASTDGTAQMLSAICDDRVRVLRNDAPQGVARARNRGIAAARGAWLAFCDDDDLWAPDKLARQLAAAKAQATLWAICGVVHFTDGDGVRPVRTPSGETIMANLPLFNVVPGGCSNVLAETHLVRAVGGFDPRLRVLADWDLWIRLARHGPPAVWDERLVAYRLHAANMSTVSRGVVRELRHIEGNSGDLRDSRIDPAWLYYWMAGAALRGGRRPAASAAFLRAVPRRGGGALFRAVGALTLPEACWRHARRLLRTVPPLNEPPPAWLAALLAVEAQRSGVR